VFLVDPHRQRGRHPDALQEDHHFLDGLLLGPGRAIIAVRLGPSPSTSISRPGSSSITCMMSTPKCATMRSAMTGPMPLIRPEPRYFWMPAAVAGSTVA